ncbi:MAG: hypothetical protein FJ356_05145 [Thaumarchaeota archaeon]|nr:hypothetical protein [Nitrososphaerota archaeon]
MRKIQSKNQSNNSEPAVIDFGQRRISDQNFSKIIAIPKTALDNCGCKNANSANVKLVQENGEKFIKLTPLECSPKEKGGEKTK